MGKLSIYDIIHYTPKYKTFVESGSFEGDTIMTFLTYFRNLYTIELDMTLFNRVKERFRPFSHVRTLQGDSKSIFPTLLPELPDYTIFYLDAHWSGDSSVDWSNSLWKGYECNTSYVGSIPTAKNQVPLGEELKSIMQHYRGHAIILIDDIEVIGKKDLKFKGEDWTHLSMDLIESIISSRVKNFNISTSSSGSPIGIIELHSLKPDYWSKQRTYSRLDIHGIDYIVEEGEFTRVEKPEYNPMIIRSEVAQLDRLIYILNKISLSTLFIGYNHGGYVMRNLKYRSYLLTNSVIDPRVLNNVDIVNEPRNTSLLYLSDENVDIDLIQYLIVVSQHILELPNRYDLDHYHFYVNNNYVTKFIKKINVRNNLIIEDNLMQLLVMVKNGGSDFYSMLKHNVPLFDNYIVMDTGSTDNTVEIIKRIIREYPHGQLYTREWKGFRDSRNEMLDIAGKDYIFNIMLDDTYYLSGDLRKFLNEVRSDDVAESFSIYIKDSFNCYISNRITKSRLDLRYVNRIHETIQTNINLRVPLEVAYLEDASSQYMSERTLSRKREDLQLQLLDYQEKPYDTNIIYHLAESYLVLKDYENAFDTYNKCIKLGKIANVEQIQDCYYKIATLAHCNLSDSFLRSRNALSWKDYYLKAYELIPDRPEALYVIGHHYSTLGENDEAYYWLEKAYQVNIRMTNTPNMNGKHAIYSSGIYDALIPLCYQKSIYNLGLQCCERTTTVYMKIFWTSVFYLLIEYYKTPSRKLHSGRMICFIAPGGWDKWDGTTLTKKGLGGTETAIVKFAETMALQDNVVVLCNCENAILYNRVIYRNIYTAPEFFATNEVDVCYINRYPEYIPLCSKAGVRDIYLILHDLMRDYEMFLDVNRIRKVFLLSEWHRRYFVEKVGPSIATGVISYGIETPVVREKKKHSFIYPSFPNRGLIHLLDIFPNIRMRYPNAVLNVFCDLDHSWSNENYPDMMREIKVKIQQEGVINHGWVDEKKLKEYWSTTHVWLYPCIFQETYCRVCLEAAANRVLMISNDLAALSENNQGIVIAGDINDEWKNKVLEVVFDFFENEAKYDEILERCSRWAKLRSYGNVIKLLQ